MSSEEIRLIHYSGKEIEKLIDLKLDQNINFHSAKPLGLWVSVEGISDEHNLNWKQWCESEEFHLEYLKYAYEVILKENANILYLKTSDEIIGFHAKYPKSLFKEMNDWKHNDTYQIDWAKVAEKYQGIIISPYQWDCRLSCDSSWYYGWDCSSGCIWDIDCIKEFNKVEDRAHV